MQLYSPNTIAARRQVTPTSLPPPTNVKDCPSGVRTIAVFAYEHLSLFQHTAASALAITSLLSPNTLTTVARVITTQIAKMMMLEAFFFTAEPV